jgi:hypothetical protein
MTRFKFTLEQATKAQRLSRCIARHVNFVAKWGWVDATQRPLYPREWGYLGGPLRNISTPPGFLPRTAQSAASRYTD